MKQTVSKQLVKHIAQLANIELDDNRVDLYQSQLSMIMDHFDDLKSLSFDDVPETSRIVEEENVWREDDVDESFTQEEALSNSKKTHDGYFMVPYLLTQKD
ncbi:MAG: Asp-tRNA(Asn)/Glu-tRNA(Gln) amidotransferase subunit GatC [Candidatus Pacebacteria bacterium]|jgi:aspartyl-tRNA(Asn)/glutamyl-tRNA(Gln) amidotransferase subunit C|nr:Asp-tRNA(Asn)/Glu-tRNA(Gln) amidotransferase subunit GatC [Candidatus Paceibacterota bacterium]MBT3512083.1 Asp-tRNA(Asn)/Glu-tRNA(Gln) amidotransferase subunit GatC [Candidatus Paceibacterota bacterium]MBT4005211.1 Asp-tRNA(Asn)/Glu-tRNA(Gln) amidotransferase subunit GatC [Candidatus Paceibacterota bacterium]MBT4358579.1 Asp-tRNA(Asn)/Glu-tRNA(Gln) amidotransferase subunit GatC [Candidatus Paceibacterota bacterium]MBT4680670.1 Asp-tRNA(Asn)/Glu-tRNA(Gln) amidotransferase subunit GatC [Candi